MMPYLFYLSLLFVVSTVNAASSYTPPKDRLPFSCEKINVLYTWVDGSDPVHAASRAARLGLDETTLAASANRFRDMNQLMYSIRSIEKFAPFTDQIFLYTDNQIPSWLNISHPKIHMIYHEDVFPNKTDLPTFNSNAIEASFPYLPDEVGPCFIYLNDDMLFSGPVYVNEFWHPGYGQFLFEDGWTAPASQETQDWEPWHKSHAVSNTMLDKRFGKASRAYTDHGPRMFSLKISREMGTVFHEEFARTMSNPLRQPDDTAWPFLYHHYTHYNYHSMSGGAISVWFGLFNDAERVCADIEHVLDNGHKAVCINDQMTYPDEEVIACTTKWMNKLLPDPSSYELTESKNSKESKA